MKTIMKTGLSITAAMVLLTGCLSGGETKNSVDAKQIEKPKQLVTEEEIGLRKVELYSEDKVAPEQTKYSTNYAGSGQVIPRAYQDAPPMIPHDVEGMLPIQVNNNQCIGCHMPEVATSMGATPIPKSHFTNFRPQHKFDGKKFEKTIDNMKNEIAIQEKDTLVNARFNCSACHAPQSEGQLVENTFNPDFTHPDGAKKSSWSGSKLTEGLDTIIGD